MYYVRHDIMLISTAFGYLNFKNIPVKALCIKSTEINLSARCLDKNQ